MSAKPRLAPLSLPEERTNRQVWRLEVRSARGAEEALFASRYDALEQARTLINDYGQTISITIVDPQGVAETLQGFSFITRRGAC
jgi:hypothetical protein